MSLEYKNKYASELKKDKNFRGSFKSYCHGPKKTRQDAKDDCDINLIIQRHTRMYGSLPTLPTQGMQLYQDNTKVGDYRSALDRVIEAKKNFHRMDKKILKRFENNPDKLIEFIENPENIEEGKRLGLFVSDPPAQPIPPAQPAPPAQPEKTEK